MDERFPPPTPPPPVEINYFAEAPDDRRRSRLMKLCTVLLVGGWVPYLCGVLNALVVSRSYVDAVTRAHTWGAALFLLGGIAASAVAVAGFTYMRQTIPAILAIVVLLTQLFLALCLGLS